MLWRVPDLLPVFDSGPVHDREDFVQVVEVSIHGRRQGIHLSTQLTVGEGLVDLGRCARRVASVMSSL